MQMRLKKLKLVLQETHHICPALAAHSLLHPCICPVSGKPGACLSQRQSSFSEGDPEHPSAPPFGLLSSSPLRLQPQFLGLPLVAGLGQARFTDPLRGPGARGKRHPVRGTVDPLTRRFPHQCRLPRPLVPGALWRSKGGPGQRYPPPPHLCLTWQLLCY